MNDNQNKNEGYWCKKDIAKYFAVSTRKIEHMMKAGLIPFLKIGGAVRFDPEKVKVFVEANFSSNSDKKSGNRRILR
jgi:excisionase family DNA binding protein